jgi:hypothetical protein
MRYVERHSLWFICFLTPLLVGNCHAGEMMKFDRIEYTKNEFPGAPNTLMIAGDGHVQFESHSNEAEPDDPEIGVWRTSLSPDQMESLAKLLESPPFRSLPDHWGRLRPGEDSRRIRVVSGADTTEKLVGYREAVDSSMQRVIDIMDRIVALVRPHPFQVLRISVADVVAKPDGTLSLVLSLTNPGTDSLICRNPATMTGGSDAQLTFQAWPDKPKDQLDSEDMMQLTPTAIDDPHSPDKMRTGPAMLELAAGATVSYGLRMSVGTGISGPYLIRALYMNPSKQIEGRAVFAGELYSRTTNVTFP